MGTQDEAAARSPRGHRAAMRAGFVRMVFATAAVVAAGQVPGLAKVRPWLWAYLAFAVAFQFMISRRLGERLVRAVVMGAVDLALLTLVTLALGSADGVIAFLYLLIPVTYATTTTRRRLSMSLAVASSAAYLVALTISYQAEPGRDVAGLASTRRELALLLTAVLVVFSIVTTTRLVSQLISALGNANHRLRELSQRDELTQLLNRRYLVQRLGEELARVHRGASLAIAMVDLDGFKRVNDEEGHDAGDAMLVAVAHALQRATRASDVITRYGGDEFVVIFPDTGQAGADAVAARIVDHTHRVGQELFPTIGVTASVGVVLARVGETATDLLRRADEQAYVAKRAGGDRLSIG